MIGLATLLMLANFSAHGKTSKQPQKAEPKQETPIAQETTLNNVKDAPPAPTLSCTGVFARDTTHAKLVAEFGAKHVAFKEVDGADGKKKMATVLFEDDPVRQAVVLWRDATARANPSAINISAPSTWIGPGGIRNGLPLKDVEKLNGGVFSINGFESSRGGFVSGLKGVLADPPGDCTLTIRFEPGIANPLPKKFAAIVGDRKVASTEKLMRRAKPMVSEWSINYQ